MNADRRVATRGILYRDGKILATKQKEDDGSEAENWATFGGGLDPQESLTDGLYREMIEETGIAPKNRETTFYSAVHPSRLQVKRAPRILFPH
jgi:ADP-ribose pyrophosphatase YjhB (NUDIX family)